MLISIIVPVYNSALYLEKCIDSILSQTYSNLELILINDGSTDSSREIMETYKKSDARIVLINKINTGVSDSRNTGIKASSGQMICFIDSDDWVDSDYLEIFTSNFENNNTLLIQSLNRNGTLKNIYKYKSYSIKTDIDPLFTDNNLLYCGGPMAKFYDQSVIQKNNILFDKNVTYGEDLIFFLEYIKHSDFIRFLPDAKYHYRLTEGSLSTKRNYPVKNYIEVHHAISQFIIWAKITKDSTLKYFYAIDWDILEAGIDQNIHKNLKNPKEDFSNLEKSITSLHYKYGNKKQKILYFFIKINNLLILKMYKSFLLKLSKLRKAI